MKPDYTDTSFKKFIIKYTVVSSALCLILADIYKKHVNAFISYLVDPVFSVDLNNDGEPDLQQLKKWNVIIGKSKVPLGLILYNLLILVVKVIVLFTFLHLLIKYLNLC